MQQWMPSVRDSRTPSGGRRLLRSLVVASAVASSAAFSAVLPGAVAAADEPVGAPVAGRLVQAWAEGAPEDAAGGHATDGPVSWVQPAEGDAVRVDSAAVADIPAGATVELTVGSDVEGASEDVAVLEVLEKEVVALPAVAPVLADPAGLTNRVTVVLVQPAGVAADGVTEADVVDTVNGPVADFWSEQSNGALRLGVTASHDWTPTTAGCATPGALWDEVAEKVGFEPGDGNHLLLYLSGRATDCAYALAEVGRATTTGGRLYVTDPGASVIAHEFGHNFGLGHSSGEQCDGEVEGSSCRTVAYRDYYDVMGVSWAQLGSLNAPQAARLDLLPASQVRALTVRGTAATAELAPLAGGAGTRAMRLTDAEGVDYWVEYRTATGRDAWLGTPEDLRALGSGVLLRRAGGLPDTSVLLDATPAAAAGWDADFQTVLPIGTAVPVSGGDFSIVVRSVSAAGALVTVTPTAPAGALAAGQAATGAAPSGDATTSEVPDGEVPGGAVTGGEVMSGTDAAPQVAGAPPVALLAPGSDGRALGTTPALESAADSSGGGGSLVAAAAGLLAAAMLLLVRRLRGGRLRAR
jgi:hypothetical protein